MATQRIPVPESYYTSPLHRCLSTAGITFSGLHLPAQQPFVPEVKELLREVIGIHTCDRRSSKTCIHTNFPTYRFEPGFAEEDDLWRPGVRETHSVHDVRICPIVITSVRLVESVVLYLGNFQSIVQHTPSIWQR